MAAGLLLLNGVLDGWAGDLFFFTLSVFIIYSFHLFLLLGLEVYIIICHIFVNSCLISLYDSIYNLCYNSNFCE